MQFVELTTKCPRCSDMGPFLLHYHYVDQGRVTRGDSPWGFECYICRINFEAREQDKKDLPEFFKV